MMHGGSISKAEKITQRHYANNSTHITPHLLHGLEKPTLVIQTYLIGYKNEKRR
jgi:hypothetical protein